MQEVGNGPCPVLTIDALKWLSSGDGGGREKPDVAVRRLATFETTGR